MPDLTPESWSSSHVPKVVERVIVTDVDMTIGAICRFMVKWAVASVPAFIILAILGAILFAAFGGLFAAISR